MTRERFALAAAATGALLLFTVVLRPAVERGGAGEVAIVFGAVALVLLVERWLRGR